MIEAGSEMMHTVELAYKCFNVALMMVLQDLMKTMLTLVGKK